MDIPNGRQDDKKMKKMINNSRDEKDFRRFTW